MALSFNLKKEIQLHCEQLVTLKINTIETAIQNIVEALKSETRSTAGDKHNTERAMMDLEREQLGKRLHIAQQEQHLLKLIRQQELKTSKNIHLGSLIETPKAIFYIAISLGKIECNSTDVFVISKETPLGKGLLNKKEGDYITFNDESLLIKNVY